MLIEYAKYGDLFSFIRKQDEQMNQKMLKFFFKVTQAIHYLHSNGMIHRDIKPENILITTNYRPKLADFGTSVYQQDAKNTFCGTFEYMAPEIYL